MNETNLKPAAILKRGFYASGNGYWDVTVLDRSLSDGTQLYAVDAQGLTDAQIDAIAGGPDLPRDLTGAFDHRAFARAIERAIGVSCQQAPNIEALAREADCMHVDLDGDRAKALERLSAFARAVLRTEAEADAEKMRAEFEAWVQDRGCDTDGAWSAWQGCWNLRRP